MLVEGAAGKLCEPEHVLCNTRALSRALPEAEASLELSLL